MIRLLYTILLILLAPFLLFGLYRKKEGKPSFGSRWKEHFGHTPELNAQERPLWIHAVSVGESIAAIPIIKALKEQFPELPILVTTTTSTGAEQIARLGNLVEHRYMPLDFPFTIKRFLRKTHPRAFLIMETELWPNTLHIVSASGIPIRVINARLSEKSCLNYKKIQPVFNLLSRHLDLVLCQHVSDAERFKRLGLPDKKVAVTGSVKFDITISPKIKKDALRLRQDIGLDRPVWIAASTHAGEDEQIFAAHNTLLKHFPDALLIVVPRHPERFIPVTELARKNNLVTVSRTSHHPVTSEIQVYVGDTMGEMLLLIGAADICFMGGSLIGEKVGGHNVLEPAALGKATITGCSYFNFHQIVNELQANNACIIVADQFQLAETLKQLFSNKQQRTELGENAEHYVENNRGAINNTIRYITEKEVEHA